MRDQAESLRLQLKKREFSRDMRAIAVISGKGGVGKSNFALNFAISLSKKGHSVLLFDMDVGMGNIDILLGETTSTTIVDIFENNLAIHDIIKVGPNNLSYIAGGTAFTKLFRFDREKQEVLIDHIESLAEQFDFILFDMGAGVSPEMLYFLRAVHEIFIITTPEPTAVTDAYAMMKHVVLQQEDTPLYVVVNRATTEREGRNTLNRLANAVRSFLEKDIVTLGILPDDKTVSKAVSRQTPFVLYDEGAGVSIALTDTVERYLNQTFDQPTSMKSFSFISKLRQYFLER